jgi:hypothetical protein
MAFPTPFRQPSYRIGDDVADHDGRRFTVTARDGYMIDLTPADGGPVSSRDVDELRTWKTYTLVAEPAAA